MTGHLVGAVAALIALSGSALAADTVRGKVVFDRWCVGCHGPLDKYIGFEPPAGTYTLQERYKGNPPALLEERTDLTPAYVKTMVRTGLNIMPATRKTEISDADLDNLIGYLMQK